MKIKHFIKELLFSLFVMASIFLATDAKAQDFEQNKENIDKVMNEEEHLEDGRRA
jgi:type III secretory pathway component EscR